MSDGKITNAGRALFASKQATSEVLTIDRFLLANIAGLDPSAPVDLDETLPSLPDRVAELPISQSGYIDADSIVYNLFLGAGEGDFTFNWVGLLADDDTLVAVRYINPITKVASAGGQPGNTITRNFLLVYSDAQTITNVTVDANTWNINFSQSTEESAGLAEIATQQEVTDGTDDQRFITPLKLLQRLQSFIKNASTSVAGIVRLATTEQTRQGTNTTAAVTPASLAGSLVQSLNLDENDRALAASQGKVLNDFLIALTNAFNQHNHNSDYAPANHNHASAYAPVSHTHSQYASSQHNHNADYAGVNHSHDAGAIIAGVLNPARLPAASPSVAGAVRAAESSKLTNGFWRCNQTGVMLVWGVTTRLQNSTGTTVFPVAFPNACVGCWANAQWNGLGGAQEKNVYSYNRTSFGLSNGRLQTLTFNYFAIGY